MLRNQKLKIVLATILLFQLPFALACDKSKARQLAKVEDDVAQGLLSVVRIVKSAKESGELNDEDIAVIKPLLQAIGDGNLQAIGITKDLNSLENIPADKKAQLLQIISFVSDQITELNNQGGLRIKNPQKRLAFNALVLTMQSAASSIVVILSLKG